MFPSESTIVTVTGSAVASSKEISSSLRVTPGGRERRPVDSLNRCTAVRVRSRSALRDPERHEAGEHQHGEHDARDRVAAAAGGRVRSGAPSTPGGRLGQILAAQREALDRVQAQPQPQRLEREDVVGRDVAEVAVGAEALEQPYLLALQGRVEDQALRVDCVRDLVDQAGAHFAVGAGRSRRCPTPVPRRSPSRRRPRGRFRSARPRCRAP